MDLLSNLALGFSVAFSPTNMIFVTIGVVVGTLFGALPGIGPAAAVSILLPLSFGMPGTTAMIMMAGMYYGAMYGGTIASVLMNIPGEASSIMTCLDGHEMALKGRAGPALTISALVSFFAGTVATVALMLLAPPIADAAIRFGPPEYFALMMLGLTAISGLTGRSKLKGYAMGLVGLAIGVVGLDLFTSRPRFTFGSLELADGIMFLPLAVGLFGIAEVAATLQVSPEQFRIFRTSLKDMMIRLQDIKDSVLPALRGTFIGFWIGVLPGAGATMATFFAYLTEKRVSKHPDRFGTGIIEGVAAPESANNSASVGAMIPMLTLGIPGSAMTAVMLGALTLFDIQPGPFLFAKNPEFVWGLIASMYIGNIMLVVLNIFFVPAFVTVLRTPYAILAPVILVFCVVGVYSLNYSVFDLWVMFAAGAVGYFMKRLDYPAAPIILSVVLGPQMETALRQSMMMSRGSVSIFFNRPLSGTIMAVVILIVLWPLVSKFLLRRGRTTGDVAQEQHVG